VIPIASPLHPSIENLAPTWGHLDMAEQKIEKDGEDRAAQPKQERGALVMTLVTVAIIAVVGAPCFCYFGIGLFHGVHVLQTGQQVNPARQPIRKKQQKRDPKYNRTFDRQPSGQPAGQEKRESPTIP